MVPANLIDWVRLRRACLLALFAVVIDGAGAQSAERQNLLKRYPTSSSPPSRGDVTSGQAKGISLSLADTIFIALRSNRSVKSAYIERIAQKFDLRVAEDRFTPKVAVSGTAVRQNVGGIEVTSANVAPNASVLLPTGATLGFAWNNSIVTGSGVQTQTSTADVNFVQPLLRGGGIDVTLAPLRGARLEDKLNRLNLKKTVSETIAQVILAYRALLQAQEELKLSQAALTRSKDLVDVNRAMIQAGRMASVEIVQSEADVESQNIRALQATKTLDDARLAMLVLLSLDLATAAVANESTEPSRISPDLPSMMQIALSERPDYLGQFLIVEQNKLGMTVAENEKLWDLSLFASGSFGRRMISGPATVPSVQKIADTTIGVTFNAPLNDLRREQPAVQATATLQTSELQLASIRQGVELQIRSSLNGINIQWKQLEAARRGVGLANRAVEIEREKLKVGRSSNLQVRLLENDLRNAEEQRLTAVVGYLNALTTIDLQLGTTLKTWRINLAD
jgi:outer membrane protein TolC